jgi:hypothetical protein
MTAAAAHPARARNPRLLRSTRASLFPHGVPGSSSGSPLRRPASFEVYPLSRSILRVKIRLILPISRRYRCGGPPVCDAPIIGAADHIPRKLWVFTGLRRLFRQQEVKLRFAAQGVRKLRIQRCTVGRSGVIAPLSLNGCIHIVVLAPAGRRLPPSDCARQSRAAALADARSAGAGPCRKFSSLASRCVATASSSTSVSPAVWVDKTASTILQLRHKAVRDGPIRFWQGYERG